ncbi:Hypothetical predicted protein [Pelobates cultripes]|uniref:Uncharacterized protein n=1 Tax=Pelobates cultripes TaxID=61616 RepID=A0AAD1SYR4_PELCU|nr:Hypothetical predicted protein [Pelobates cultripes]
MPKLHQPSMTQLSLEEPLNQAFKNFWTKLRSRIQRRSPKSPMASLLLPSPLCSTAKPKFSEQHPDTVKGKLKGKPQCIGSPPTTRSCFAPISSWATVQQGMSLHKSLHPLNSPSSMRPKQDKHQ